MRDRHEKSATREVTIDRSRAEMVTATKPACSDGCGDHDDLDFECGTEDSAGDEPSWDSRDRSSQISGGRLLATQPLVAPMAPIRLVRRELVAAPIVGGPPPRKVAATARKSVAHERPAQHFKRSAQQRVGFAFDRSWIELTAVETGVALQANLPDGATATKRPTDEYPGRRAGTGLPTWQPTWIPWTPDLASSVVAPPFQLTLGPPHNPVVLWPNGVVPYTIDASLANIANDLAIVTGAIVTWNRSLQGFVKLVPRSPSDQHWVTFIRETREKDTTDLTYGDNPIWVNTSRIGYTTTGNETNGTTAKQQFIWIRDVNKAAIEHEIGHVFGLIHPQSRSDRDQWLRSQVNWLPTFRYRCDPLIDWKRNPWTANLLIDSIDYRSLMIAKREWLANDTRFTMRDLRGDAIGRSGIRPSDTARVQHYYHLQRNPSWTSFRSISPPTLPPPGCAPFPPSPNVTGDIELSGTPGAVDSGGRIIVSSLGTDGAVYLQELPHGGTLGRAIRLTDDAFSAPALAVARDGSIHLVCFRGSPSRLMHAELGRGEAALWRPVGDQNNTPPLSDGFVPFLSANTLGGVTCLARANGVGIFSSHFSTETRRWSVWVELPGNRVGSDEDLVGAGAVGNEFITAAFDARTDRLTFRAGGTLDIVWREWASEGIHLVDGSRVAIVPHESRLGARAFASLRSGGGSLVRWRFPMLWTGDERGVWEPIGGLPAEPSWPIVVPERPFGRNSPGRVLFVERPFLGFDGTEIQPGLLWECRYA